MCICVCVCVVYVHLLECAAGGREVWFGSIIISCSRTGSPASSDSPRMCVHQHPDGGSQKLIYTLCDTTCCTTVTAPKRSTQAAHTHTRRETHTHPNQPLNKSHYSGSRSTGSKKFLHLISSIFFFFHKPGHPPCPLFTPRPSAPSVFTFSKWS